MQYHRWELGRVRGRGRGRAVDRARRDPEEGQGYRRLSTTCLRPQGPRLSLLGEKRGLPPAYEDLFSTPLPRGTQAPEPAALRMQRGLTSRPPPASRSTGVPSTAAIAQPLLLTVARSQYFAQNARDPTSTSGVLPKEAVPLPSRPSADPAVPTNTRARPQVASHRLRFLLCADSFRPVVRWVSHGSIPKRSSARQVGAPAGAGARWVRLPQKCRGLRRS